MRRASSTVLCHLARYTRTSVSLSKNFITHFSSLTTTTTTSPANEYYHNHPSPTHLKTCNKSNALVFSKIKTKQFQAYPSQNSNTLVKQQPPQVSSRQRKIKERSQLEEDLESANTTEDMLKAFKDMEASFDERENCSVSFFLVSPGLGFSQNQSATMAEIGKMKLETRWQPLLRGGQISRGKQFPLAIEVARKAVVAPIRNRAFNRSKAVSVNKLRYHIRLEVIDGNDKATVILFDELATSLIGCTVSDYITQYARVTHSTTGQTLTIIAQGIEVARGDNFEKVNEEEKYETKKKRKLKKKIVEAIDEVEPISIDDENINNFKPNEKEPIEIEDDENLKDFYKKQKQVP
ncbi:hypothetical protein F0562_034177 [Nyssa sinensis]|uniref:Replication factor A C-terminal domain-containing protein n=1 Tax=Nyssa sinensis TaxID=561372 RepID=A0A5J5AFF1_9ASTE|nr:hypothetical protein F0562_034177 [Nyssa sinensis]